MKPKNYATIFNGIVFCSRMTVGKLYMTILMLFRHQKRTFFYKRSYCVTLRNMIL